MSFNNIVVTEVADLILAAQDQRVQNIIVDGILDNVPSFTLFPKQNLQGKTSEAAIYFAKGQSGVRLSTDNRVENLHLHSDVTQRAIFNDTTVATLGRLHLNNLVIHGVVQILARDQVKAGHVEVNNIDIIAADARGYTEYPKGYGVEVIQGAFTLWNQQLDESVRITANLIGIYIGRPQAPVMGSGVFVSGAGDVGGKLIVRTLETGDVHSDGGIQPGVAGFITGGVFTVYGANVDLVHNLGTVTTYGVNDMVLDNWGYVDQWIAEEKVTSYGPSGIGFVNFGTVNKFVAKQTIETYGQGARGFNVYSGTVVSAEFERIVTHADGAVGIQVSQPIGTITVRRGIETNGGTGDSLVKGVVVRLAAIAFSVKPGGSIKEVNISGGITTHGVGVNPLELNGSIEKLNIQGGIISLGQGFDKI